MDISIDTATEIKYILNSNKKKEMYLRKLSKNKNAARLCHQTQNEINLQKTNTRTFPLTDIEMLH